MTLDVFNPATGGVLATCPRADEAQLDEAVAAAKAAFPAWSALSFSERRKKLEAIADALETRMNEFARLLTQEQGKPTAQATGEVMVAIAGMRYFAAAEVETKIIRETERERILEQRTLLGVVGAIMPWKLPEAADGDQDRPGADHRKHDRGQAGADNAPDRAAVRREGR